MGSAVSGVRNRVYDLFGRRTGGPDAPGSAPGAVPVPAEGQQPEIIEAPLVPLETATPRAQPLPPVTYDEEPEAASPEMAPVPQPGTVLFHRDIGDQVKAGDLLATLITKPGAPDGTLEVKAAHDGLVATRTSARYARRGDDLMKIACHEATRKDRKPGTLED